MLHPATIRAQSASSPSTRFCSTARGLSRQPPSIAASKQSCRAPRYRRPLRRRRPASIPERAPLNSNSCSLRSFIASGWAIFRNVAAVSRHRRRCRQALPPPQPPPRPGARAHRRSWPASTAVSSSRRHLRRDAAQSLPHFIRVPLFRTRRYCPGLESSPRQQTSTDTAAVGG